jgi:predicted DNA-binding protein (MmcQ/YjbR family)
VKDVFERPVFARARRLCLAFPETSERTAWGHPNFRAGKKMFCAFEILKGRPSIAVKLSPTDIDFALKRNDFFVTPYGRGLWASVWVDGAVDWKLMASLLERSYRLVANKRMLRVLDSAGGLE